MVFCRLLSFIVILLVHCQMSEGIYRKWTANTNFGSDINWDTGHVPCGPVSVRIPELAPQIYVQLDTTIKELILPNNVELILGDGLNLVFSDTDPNPPNCKNPATGDVNFVATSPVSWFNPDNWCPLETGGGDCKNMALLDTEQVPCKSDDVIFPLTSTYYVNLESGFDITVGTLKMSGLSYTTQSFKSFLAKDIGLRTFPPPSSDPQSTVNILGTPKKCSDITGCACGNDSPKVQEKICAYKSSSCASIFCEKPLRAGGACCDMCGAILEMTYGTGFKFTFLRDSMKSSFINGKPNAANVSYIVSKRGDGKIQMVLSDEAGNNSLPFANAIKKALDDDIANGGVKYKITSVNLKVSHGAFKPPEAHTGGLGGGQIAGLVVGLIVICVVVLVIAFFIYRRKTRALSFSDQFSGFGVSSIRDKIRSFRKTNSEAPASVRFSEISGAHVQGLDNPVYGIGELQGRSMVEMPQEASYNISQPRAGDAGFDNPLYDTIQESKFSDPAFHINPTFNASEADDDNH